MKRKKERNEGWKRERRWVREEGRENIGGEKRKEERSECVIEQSSKNSFREDGVAP